MSRTKETKEFGEVFGHVNLDDSIVIPVMVHLTALEIAAIEYALDMLRKSSLRGTDTGRAAGSALRKIRASGD